MEWSFVAILLLTTVLLKARCMADFPKHDDFNSTNDTEFSQKFSTHINNMPHTDPHTTDSDSHAIKPSDLPWWFQGNIKTNLKGDKSLSEHTSVGAILPESRSYKQTPHDSSHNINQFLMDEPSLHSGSHPITSSMQGFNTYLHQTPLQSHLLNNDVRIDNQESLPYLLSELYKQLKTKNSAFDHHTSFNPLDTMNINNSSSSISSFSEMSHILHNQEHNEIPTMLHQQGNRNLYDYKGYPKSSNCFPWQHLQSLALFPAIRNVPQHTSDNLAVYPAYNPMSVPLSYREQFRQNAPYHHTNEIGHNPFGMTVPHDARYPASDDLGSLIADFQVPRRAAVMPEDSFGDRLGSSHKPKAKSESRHGFKNFLDKFLHKTENVMKKWGPKIQKVGDAVEAIFGFLKFASNLPQFHQHD